MRNLISEVDPITFLQQARNLMTVPEVIMVLGPIPAPMQRKQGRYRAHLLLQTRNRGACCNNLLLRGCSIGSFVYEGRALVVGCGSAVFGMITFKTI